MKLYIKQKVFSWNEKFTIKDENGNDKYYAESEFLTLGHKLHVYDTAGNEVAYIAEKVFTFLPKYYVYINGSEVAEIVKEFTLWRPSYTINGLGWNVDGSPWEHSYSIYDNGNPIVTIEKEWFTWGDSYMLDIPNQQYEVTALAVALVIDCVLCNQKN
jgi:Uncharacterized conserved protein